MNFWEQYLSAEERVFSATDITGHVIWLLVVDFSSAATETSTAHKGVLENGVM